MDENQATLPNPSNMVDYDYQVFGKKEPESFREIVIRQIDECRRQLSKQLIEGGVYYIKDKGVMVPKVMDDQLEIDERVVQQLFDLMLYTLDDEAIKNIDRIDDNFQKTKSKLIAEYSAVEVDRGIREIALKSNEMPVHTSAANKIYMLKLRKEKDLMLRNIYQELLLLFKRKNDLSKVRKIGPY